MLRKSQSTLEYSILVAIIVAGLLGMQIYMKRGVEGRLRSSADSIGEQFDARRSNYTYTTDRTSTTVEEVENGLSASYMGYDDGEGAKGTEEQVTRFGTESVSAW